MKRQKQEEKRKNNVRYEYHRTLTSRWFQFWWWLLCCCCCCCCSLSSSSCRVLPRNIWTRRFGRDYFSFDFCFDFDFDGYRRPSRTTRRWRRRPDRVVEAAVELSSSSLSPCWYLLPMVASSPAACCGATSPPPPCPYPLGSWSEDSPCAASVDRTGQSPHNTGRNSTGIVVLVVVFFGGSLPRGLLLARGAIACVGFFLLLLLVILLFRRRRIRGYSLVPILIRARMWVCASSSSMCIRIRIVCSSSSIVRNSSSIVRSSSSSSRSSRSRRSRNRNSSSSTSSIGAACAGHGGREIPRCGTWISLPHWHI